MRYLLASLITLFFVACGASGTPSWTVMPPSDGKVYGVGSSPIHVKGLTFQRALAISRAIDEIARQKGVTVSNTLERVESVTSAGHASSAAQSYSVQSVDGQKVNAKIKEVYRDPRSNKIFVLMVAN